MSGRESGIRHALDTARRARKAMDDGRVAPAIRDWNHASNHLAFTVGLCEQSKLSLAAVLLRSALVHLGERIDKAVAARVEVPGYEIGDVIVQTFIAITDDYPVRTETIAELAAKAAVEIHNRFRVEERRR